MGIRINISGAVRWGGERRVGSESQTGTKTQTMYLLAVIL